MEWGAAALQAVLFSKATPFPSSLDFYEALFGTEPDLNEERPKEGVRRQSGQVGDVQVQVLINPLRIDVILSPLGNATLGADGMTVSMGEFGAEADKFAEKVTKWIAGFEMSLSRVSFLSVAVAPASSREDAYAILAESVKSLKITPAMRDLLYRVNWRGNTAHLEEGYLNRLAAWSSFQLTATAGISGQRDTLKLSQRDFARIDLDINTPPERAEPLPQSKLPSLFLELVALAKETVAKGECMT